MTKRTVDREFAEILEIARNLEADHEHDIEMLMLVLAPLVKPEVRDDHAVHHLLDTVLGGSLIRAIAHGLVFERNLNWERYQAWVKETVAEDSAFSEAAADHLEAILAAEQGNGSERVN